MLSILGILLAVACASDVALHRIPNSLVVGVAATGVLGAALESGALGVAGSAAALAITAAAVWPAWARGWVGGGDLKLGASAAAWVGVERLPLYLVSSAIAVGVVSIICYAASAQDSRSQVRRNLALAARGVAFTAPIRSEAGRAQVPAGVGFAVGALVALLLTGGL
jgi:prepilin peptidase CpaA